MVFGNCGVLQEMSADKGFVEMTGIDAETSQDIAEVYPYLPKALFVQQIISETRLLIA